MAGAERGASPITSALRRPGEATEGSSRRDHRIEASHPTIDWTHRLRVPAGARPVVSQLRSTARGSCEEPAPRFDTRLLVIDKKARRRSERVSPTLRGRLGLRPRCSRSGNVRWSPRLPMTASMVVAIARPCRPARCAPFASVRPHRSQRSSNRRRGARLRDRRLDTAEACGSRMRLLKT